MVVTVLSENTSLGGLGCEHGLSLLIETAGRYVLFDMGASDLFAQNAVRLGADLRRVSIAALSHGHYDHGGGLKTFLETNASSPVFVSAGAFDRRYAVDVAGGRREIGLDASLLGNPRFVTAGRRHLIAEGLFLFSNVERVYPPPSGNAGLCVERGIELVPDDFAHEQNLLVVEGKKAALFCGCAHCGIANILERARLELGRYPDAVFGGFHLHSPSRGEDESEEGVLETGRFLLKTGAMCYTCHCTGEGPFRILKSVMGPMVEYVPAGARVTL